VDRPRRCRGDSRVGLDPGRRRDNRALRLTTNQLSRGLGTVLLAISMAACSMSFPIAGFRADDPPTGSIDRSAALLSPALDREDWRRAEAALSVALDPQGNGAGVGWRNPQTGSKGSFAAPAPPFLDHEQVCRSFKAEVSSGSQGPTHLSGSACRDGDGTWRLRDTKGGQTS
jgi:surface antigen